jgi:hypothetical protein
MSGDSGRRGLDPNDVFFSLTDEGASEGLTTASGLIRVWARDDDRSDMVGEHERCHVRLNLATSFGALLIFTGLAQAQVSVKSRPALREVADLLGLCRSTHETYATALGAWRTTFDPRIALEGYSAYLRYLEIAEMLAGHHEPGTLAADLVVTAACQCAMSPPELVAGGRAVGPRSIAYWPDVRLRALVQSNSDTSWITELLPDLATRKPVVEVRDDLSQLTELTADLVARLYQQFASELDRQSMPTQDYGAHLGDAELVTALRRMPALAPLGREWSQGDAATSIEVALADAEHWIGPLTDTEASVELLDEYMTRVGPRALEAMLFGADGLEHLSLIVRPVGLLLEQYRMSEESETVLRASAVEGAVATALRAVIPDPDGAYTLICPLTGRRQLDALRRAAAALPVVTTISEACNAMSTWSRYWAKPLVSETYVTLVSDLPLTGWVPLFAQSAPSVRATLLRFSIDEEERDLPAAMTVLLAHDVAPYPRLFGGSPSMTESVIHALERSGVKVDGELVIEDRGPLYAAITRLVYEEPWWHRQSLRYFRENWSYDGRPRGQGASGYWPSSPSAPTDRSLE